MAGSPEGVSKTLWAGITWGKSRGQSFQRQRSDLFRDRHQKEPGDVNLGVLRLMEGSGVEGLWEWFRHKGDVRALL